MARIAGINIPMNKHVWVGLTSIFGVGRTQALKACAGANVKPNTIVKDLNNELTVMPFSTTIDIPNQIKRTVDVNALEMTQDTRSWLETNRNSSAYRPVPSGARAARSPASTRGRSSGWIAFSQP